MITTRFRMLILCYIATLAATGVEELYFPAQFSEELATAYSTEALHPFALNPNVFLVLSAIAVVAIVVPPAAMFYFRKWGRSFGVCATVAMLVALPFLGPSLSSGFGTAVSQLSAILWGAIIALAYFSPVSRDFR
ncbi:MAG: hypothetical protein ACRECW_18600 [Phyllobacterium sp.]